MSGRNFGCDNCEWWVENGPQLANATRDLVKASRVGTCQVRPPAAMLLAGVIVTVFPETHADRFCGEWGPQDAEAPSPGEKHRIPASEVVSIGAAAKPRPVEALPTAARRRA